MGTNTMWGSPAKLSTVNGNTVLVGADSVPFDRFPLPLNPNGLDWLTDTINSLDIYDYFVRRPTFFYDPQSTATLSNGTFKSPFKTPAELAAFVLNRDMAGQRLGVKRGSVTKDESSALSLSNLMTLRTYSSSSSDPFMIVPYGDAEALPIITGERDCGTGTNYPWTYASGSIYYISVDANCHVWNLNNPNGQMRSQAQSSLANVTKPGMSYYDSGASRLYFWPWQSENPNDTDYKINYAFRALALTAANVANSGNVRMVGIEARMGRNNSLFVGLNSSDYTTIDTLPNWDLIGNKIWASGRDQASYGSENSSNSAVVFFGGYKGSAVVPFSGGLIAANEFSETLNNTLDLSGMDSTTLEFNYGHDVGGNAGAELYASCSNFTIRYNVGKTASDSYLNSDNAVQNFLASSYSESFVWMGAYQITAPFTATSVTSSSTTSGCDNNHMHHNLVIGCNWGFKVDIGTGHKAQQNTFVYYGDDPRITSPSAFGIRNEQAAHTDFSNNIVCNFAGIVAGTSIIGMHTRSAAAKLPTGDGNVYYSNGSGGIKWKINDANVAFSFADWKAVAAVVSAGLDQTLSAQPSTANLAWDSTYHRPGVGSTVIAGGKASLGLGTRYRLGNVRDDAAPTAGSEGNG